MDPTKWNAPFLVVLAALFFIVFCRAGGTYWLGRAILLGGTHTKAARFLNSPGYHRAQRWIDRWGAPAVALSFLTIGLQTMVNLAAGAGRMSLRRYLPSLIVGSSAWALLYATVGFVSAAAITKLWDRSPVLTIVSGVAFLGLVLALVFWRRRETSTQAIVETGTQS